MRIRLNLRWLLVPVLFFSLQLCRANNLTFNFDTNSIPLWDLSGSYSLTLSIQEPNGAVIPVSLAFNMHQDAAGRLHGFANDFQSVSIDENSFFTVTYSITGSVTGINGDATAHFVVHFVGNGSSSGLPNGPFNATLLVNATIGTDTNGAPTLRPNKPIRFVAKLPQTSVRGIDSTSTIPLPPGEDGSWSLNLQFDTLNRVVGTAIITTPSQSLGFNLFGVFKDPDYILRITGATDVASTVSGVGSAATIVLDSADLSTVQSLNGRIMGQRITF